MWCGSMWMLAVVAADSEEGAQMVHWRCGSRGQTAHVHWTWGGLRYRLIPVWLMATLISACLAESWYQPASAQALLPAGKIGDGVMETLRARGTVHVIVALTEPPSVRALGGNLSTMK